MERATENPFRTQVLYDSRGAPDCDPVTGYPNDSFFHVKSGEKGLVETIRKLIQELVVKFGAIFSPVTRLAKAETLLTEWDRDSGLFGCSTPELAAKAATLSGWRQDVSIKKTIQAGYWPALDAFISGITQLTGAKDPVISAMELDAAHRFKPHGGPSQDGDFSRNFRALADDNQARLFPLEKDLEALPRNFEKARLDLLMAYRDVREAVRDYQANASTDKEKRISDAATKFAEAAKTWSNTLEHAMELNLSGHRPARARLVHPTKGAPPR